REQRDPNGTNRREQAGEQEDQREQRSRENPEHGDGGPSLEARARIGGPSGQVRDEGCEPGCRDRKGRDRDYAPERAIGPEEEERRARRQDRRRSERREEEEAVAEVVHGTVQVSVRPARGGHVNRDDGGRYQESAGVSGHNQTDLDGRAAQISGKMPRSRSGAATVSNAWRNGAVGGPRPRA